MARRSVPVRHASRVGPVAAALLVASAGVLLPVAGTARLLRGDGAVPLAQLILGVRLLKVVLVLTVLSALALMAAARAAGLPFRRASSTDGPHPLGRNTIVLLAGVLLGATILRVHGLRSELWVDEIDTLFDYVRLPFAQMLGAYGSQNHHPLYSLAARVAYLGSGGADWAIRIPAVAFGVASLWATFALARRITSTVEALLATLFLACSYHHLWFSQNARGYTAILFFTIVATTVMHRLLREESTRPMADAWVYGAVMALAAYTHLTAILVGVGHGAALAVILAGRRDRVTLRRLSWPIIAIILSGLLTLCLYSTVLPQLVRQVLQPTTGGIAIEWTNPRWLVSETFRVLASGTPGGVALAGAGIVVLLIGVASYWRESREIVLVMLLPVLTTGVAVLGLHHNLWPRFFFFGASFFVLFAVRGGFAICRTLLGSRGPSVALAGALVAVVLSAMTIPRAWAPKQQFQAAARYVDQARAPRDRVVAVDVAAYVYRRYPAREAWRLTDSLDSLVAIERAAPRTWVLYTFPARLEAILPAVAAHVALGGYREQRVFPATVGGGEIHVLVRDSSMNHD